VTCRSARSVTPRIAIMAMPTTLWQHHCTGEGDSPLSYELLPSGENANSQSHQFASGRFGVTPGYLRHCRVIQIKIAQGWRKPGMGGFSPVVKWCPSSPRCATSTRTEAAIAILNNEDIYSIEDLNAVIYKLRQLNPAARIAVKIVSVSGAAMGPRALPRPGPISVLDGRP